MKENIIKYDKIFHNLFAMIVQSNFNVCDSIYVTQCCPIQDLMIPPHEVCMISLMDDYINI